jgi:hypothetical protein
MKLLGIIGVDFEVIDQLGSDILNSSYTGKNKRTMGQYISYL